MQKHISVVRSFLNCVGIVTSVFGKTIIHKEHILRLDRLGRVSKFVELSVASSVMFFSTLIITLKNNKQHQVVLNK